MVKEKGGLVSLLQEYADTFAWTYANIPRLDIDIMVHQIPLMEGSKPTKQKIRRMRPNILFNVKTKTQKQWDAGFLESGSLSLIGG